MEKISITGLQLCTIIGTLPHERVCRQQLILDLELFCSGKAAEISDDLAQAVDYSAVEKAVVETVEKSSYFLLEALAGAIGKTVLSFSGVLCCQVKLSKPAASAYGALISYQSEFIREQ